MSASPAAQTRRIWRLHRYLSCFLAPAMLFFAMSGAWQAFRLHEDHKSGYHAPGVLKDLSQFHKAEHLQDGLAGTLFRSGQIVIAAAFGLAAILGLVMAFRVTRPRWLVWLSLAGGLALPIALALLSRKP